MQAAVEDYFDTDTTEDLVLLRLISLTAKLIDRGQLFQPMDEPYFWAAYFRAWVAKGIEERGKIIQGQEELIQKNLGFAE